MDSVRFLAGIFYTIWSILGIVLLIASIALIGFMTEAKSFLQNSSLDMMGNGREQGGGQGTQQTSAGYWDQKCLNSVVGEQEASRIAQSGKVTPEESQTIQQCYRR